jgi:hypothetical protein
MIDGSARSMSEQELARALDRPMVRFVGRRKPSLRQRYNGKGHTSQSVGVNCGL